MTQEIRAGYATTTFLEQMCLDYIRAFTINGKFTGDVHYLLSYQHFHRYNNQPEISLRGVAKLPTYTGSRKNEKFRQN